MSRTNDHQSSLVCRYKYRNRYRYIGQWFVDRIL